MAHSKTIRQMAVEFTHEQMRLSVMGAPGLVELSLLPRRTDCRIRAEAGYRGFYTRGASDALDEVEAIINEAGSTQDAVRLIGQRIEVMRRTPGRDRSPSFWKELSKLPGQANKI